MAFFPFGRRHLEKVYAPIGYNFMLRPQVQAGWGYLSNANAYRVPVEKQWVAVSQRYCGSLGNPYAYFTTGFTGGPRLEKRHRR